MSEEEEIQKQTVIEDEKPISSLAEKLRQEKINKKKKQNKIIIAAISVSIISVGFWWLTKPFKASEEYAVCRTLLELKLPYPHTLYVSEVNDMIRGGLRLWYTYTDAFGEYRMERFICKLARDPETNTLNIEKLTMNKLEVARDEIASLNSALIYFQENPLVLNYPTALPDSLNDLQFQTNAFRRYKLNMQKIY